MMKKTILCVGTLLLVAATAQAQTITVTSPNGGESWAQSGVRTITWTSDSLPAGQTLQLILWHNGLRVGDIAFNVSAAQGAYAWTVGTYQGGLAAPDAGYRVRVRVPNGVFDDGDDPFTITAGAATATLRLTVPNGGESWASGTTQTIRWEATNLAGNVKLELLQGGAVIGTIALAPAVAQAYNWKVGQHSGGVAPMGGNYKIGMTSMSSLLIDPSDAPFSIVLGVLGGGMIEVERVPLLPRPDLVVCLRRNSHIHVPGSGTVTARIKNVGLGASTATRARIHFEGDGTKLRAVPALAPGQIHAVGRHEYYTLAGKKDVTITVDDNQQVAETNENNNVATGILHRTADAFWAEEPFVCSDGSIVPIGQ